MITTIDDSVRISGNSEATFSEERKGVKPGAWSKVGVGFAMVAGVLTIQGYPHGSTISTPTSISSSPYAYNVGVRVYANSKTGIMEESTVKPNNGSNSQSNSRKYVKGNVVKSTIATRTLTSLSPIDAPIEHAILDSPFKDSSRVIKSNSISYSSLGGAKK